MAFATQQNQKFCYAGKLVPKPLYMKKTAGYCSLIGKLEKRRNSPSRVFLEKRDVVNMIASRIVRFVEAKGMREVDFSI